VSASHRTSRQIALEFIARSPDGCTERELRDEGFGVMILVHMVRAGLIVAKTNADKDGSTHQRFTITELGRRKISE
jgi:hypothetical protein